MCSSFSCHPNLSSLIKFSRVKLQSPVDDSDPHFLRGLLGIPFLQQSIKANYSDLLLPVGQVLSSVDQRAKGQRDMVASNFDAGIITAPLNWSLLSLKHYSLDLCLECIPEGFLMTSPRVCVRAHRLVDCSTPVSSALCSRYGIARGAYSSGGGSSGTALWTLEATKHRLLGIHLGCHEEANPAYPNIYVPAVVLRQLVRYCSDLQW